MTFDKKLKTNRLLAAAWISIICIGFDIIGLFGGFTLFHHCNNIIFVILRSLGILFTLLFLGLQWSYYIYWFIFLISCLIPAIIETITIIKIIICQTRKY